MKKYILFFFVLCLAACAHKSEQVIGYNEDGFTIVRVCTSHGNLVNPSAFGSDCEIELRDYGRISNPSNTVNVISNDRR